MSEEYKRVNNFESDNPDNDHARAASPETAEMTVGGDADVPAECSATEPTVSTDAVDEKSKDTGNAEIPPDPETRIAALTAERDLLRDQLLRLRADFDNFRKRVLRETETMRSTAARETIRSLLPVRDNLERALTHDPADGAAFAEGVRMILRQFDEALAAQGLEAIEAEGQDFDPNVHEALTYAPSETVPAGRVATVYERGYRIGGVLLRPARVVVSSGPPGGDSRTSGDGAPTEKRPEPEATAQTETEPSKIET